MAQSVMAAILTAPLSFPYFLYPQFLLISYNYFLHLVDFSNGIGDRLFFKT